MPPTTATGAAKAVRPAQDNGIGSKVHTAVLLSALAVVISRGWLMPLHSSFWSDEAGTYFMVSGSWQQFLDRMSHTIESPLYCSFMWLWFHLVGANEILLRLPSIIAMGVAAVLVYVITRRQSDSQTGLLAALIFAALPETSLFACQARPYALGIALAASSVYLTIRWLQFRSARIAVLLAISLTLVFYCQPVNGLMALVVVAAVLCAYFKRRGPPIGQAVLAALLAICLSVPICGYYWNAMREARTYSTIGTPGFVDLLNTSLCFAGVILVVLCSAMVAGASFADLRRHGLGGSLVICWCAVPPLALFLVSTVSPAKLFLVKYYSVHLPAVAIMAAIAARSIPKVAMRLIVVCALCLTMSARTWPLTEWPALGWWRETAAALRAQQYGRETLVLVRTGFTEAKRLERLSDPAYRDFILAPLRMYPFPGHIIALADTPTAEVEPYLQDLLRTALKESQFYVVDVVGPTVWVKWFAERLGDGWTFQRVSCPGYGEVFRVARKERKSPG